MGEAPSTGIWHRKGKRNMIFFIAGGGRPSSLAPELKCGPLPVQLSGRESTV